MSKSIEVLHEINNTTGKDEFTADEVSTQVWGDGRGYVKMSNGKDDEGPVDTVIYGKVGRIKIRPLT